MSDIELRRNVNFVYESDPSQTKESIAEGFGITVEKVEELLQPL